MLCVPVFAASAHAAEMPPSIRLVGLIGNRAVIEVAGAHQAVRDGDIVSAGGRTYRASIAGRSLSLTPRNGGASRTWSIGIDFRAGVVETHRPPRATGRTSPPPATSADPTGFTEADDVRLFELGTGDLVAEGSLVGWQFTEGSRPPLDPAAVSREIEP